MLDETTFSSVIRAGTAGWSIPSAARDAFSAEGTGLVRYASRFNAVEINSTFYKSHKTATFAKWREAVPADFRFSLKLPKEITHTRRLLDCGAQLEAFIDDIKPLGDRMGPLLVQLPLSLDFEAASISRFFNALRDAFQGSVACEPRHASWFCSEADELLSDWKSARVAADPAVVPAAARPAGFSGLTYIRLHGSPARYRSSYDRGALRALSVQALAAVQARSECCIIFNNTMIGAATSNALELRAILRQT